MVLYMRSKATSQSVSQSKEQKFRKLMAKGVASWMKFVGIRICIRTVVYFIVRSTFFPLLSHLTVLHITGPDQIFPWHVGWLKTYMDWWWGFWFIYPSKLYSTRPRFHVSSPLSTARTVHSMPELSKSTWTLSLPGIGFASLGMKSPLLRKLRQEIWSSWSY